MVSSQVARHDAWRASETVPSHSAGSESSLAHRPVVHSESLLQKLAQVIAVLAEGSSQPGSNIGCGIVAAPLEPEPSPSSPPDNEHADEPRSVARRNGRDARGARFMRVRRTTETHARSAAWRAEKHRKSEP